MTTTTTMTKSEQTMRQASFGGGGTTDLFYKCQGCYTISQWAPGLTNSRHKQHPTQVPSKQGQTDGNRDTARRQLDQFPEHPAS
uniref:Uncharacterized protein n=1 Tax=Physcomitrium patens TaxID=3218 RepID=A0A2K1JCL1_PHYPA|nr:hypothetical protein PHYPA_019548 [Physcomitrium patens]